MVRTGTSRGIRLAAVLAVSAFATPARSQQQEQPAPPPPDEAHGREEKPPEIEPEDVPLFVPRVVLAVPRLAFHILYYPVRKGLRWVQSEHVIEELEDFFYNDERTAAILPTASINSFFGPSIGARAFHEDLAGHGEEGEIEAKAFGRYQQAYLVSFKADRAGGTRTWVEMFSRFEVTPQQLFQGLGDLDDGGSLPNASPRATAIESRYRHQRFLQVARLGYTAGEESALTKVGVTGKLKRHDFGPGEDLGAGELPIDRIYDTAQLPGFDLGATVFEGNLNVVIDTRDVEGATSSGMYLEAFGGLAREAGTDAYGHYGAEVTGYFDLYRKTRVLVLRGVVEAVHGDDVDIPFVELPTLGGSRRLRGYPLHRFRAEKSLLATVEYHYPIHQYVAGALYVDAGRVGDSYGDIFEDADFRVGGGGGFIVRSEDSLFVTLDIAYGDGLQVIMTTDPLRAFGNEDEEL